MVVVLLLLAVRALRRCEREWKACNRQRELKVRHRLQTLVQLLHLRHQALAFYTLALRLPSASRQRRRTRQAFYLLLLSPPALILLPLSLPVLDDANEATLECG